MKKFMIVTLLVALVAGVWTSMVKADAKQDLQQAAEIAKAVNSIAPGLIQLAGPEKPAVKSLGMVINLGTTSIMTAATLSQTIDKFPTTSQDAFKSLGNAAKAVKAASDKLKDPKLTATAQAQIDALMEYLDAQGKFIGVIADYLVYVEDALINPVFTLLESMPFVGPKIVMINPDTGKPTQISLVLGGMLTALQTRNKTYINAVKALPTVIKSVEKAAATGNVETATSEVKAADFGF